MKGNFLAIVLVATGIFFLLNNLGLIDVSLWGLLRTWWPAILIAVGVALFFVPDTKGRRCWRARLPPCATARWGAATCGCRACAWAP